MIRSVSTKLNVSRTFCFPRRLAYLEDPSAAPPYDFDRIDGMVGVGQAQTGMMIVFFLSWGLCVVSWACAYSVAKQPRFSEGEPTVVYLC